MLADACDYRENRPLDSGMHDVSHDVPGQKANRRGAPEPSDLRLPAPVETEHLRASLPKSASVPERSAEKVHSSHGRQVEHGQLVASTAQKGIRRALTRSRSPTERDTVSHRSPDRRRMEKQTPMQRQGRGKRHSHERVKLSESGGVSYEALPFAQVILAAGTAGKSDLRGSSQGQADGLGRIRGGPGVFNSSERPENDGFDARRPRILAGLEGSIPLGRSFKHGRSSFNPEFQSADGQGQVHRVRPQALKKPLQGGFPGCFAQERPKETGSKASRQTIRGAS